MEIWLWAIIGILVFAVIALLIKIYMLQKAAREISEAFADRLTADTNTLIDISSTDKHMRRLANDINVQLRKLRSQRHRFRLGDTELKNAVTNISHDLRTPLAAIYGYLDLLEQEENTDDARRYIEIIRNRAEILTQLTEELFHYSVIVNTMENEMRQPVIINHALEESIAAFYTVLTQRNIIPNIQIPKNKIVRKLNHSALTRVFSNLINNAIKYSDGDLDISLSETGEILFANTASGLNAVQIGKLFDRFYTVEAARKSTGLGLAIAKTLVEQMEGTISADYMDNKLYIRLFFPER